MFTRDDLAALAAVETSLAVSVFLPTEIRGAETRQGPIRLKNLLTDARDLLVADGASGSQADRLLAPGWGLVEDHEFWRHQDHGLALFLGEQGLEHFSVPVALEEQVVVGSQFQLKPLLPLLSRGEDFWLVSLAAGQVRLLRGSASALDEDDSVADLPASLEDVAADPDYENPVQASPVARSGTGSINIGNAQVYGDSPPDWRKNQLVEFARRVAAAVDGAAARSGLPVVLVADAELGGHFQQASRLGSQLVGTVETNPAALDDRQLHEAAYAVLGPRLDAERAQVVEQFAALRGQQDARAVAGAEDVAVAAHHGRVETLLLRLGATVPGRYDPATATVELSGGGDRTVGSTDLVEESALLTLGAGGEICLLEPAELPEVEHLAAVLRY
ncbi:hypothetical protein GCM10009616_14390 [Microlunatus lacustris]